MQYMPLLTKTCRAKWLLQQTYNQSIDLSYNSSNDKKSAGFYSRNAAIMCNIKFKQLENPLHACVNVYVFKLKHSKFIATCNRLTPTDTTSPSTTSPRLFSLSRCRSAVGDEFVYEMYLHYQEYFMYIFVKHAVLGLYCHVIQGFYMRPV